LLPGSSSSSKISEKIRSISEAISKAVKVECDCYIDGDLLESNLTPDQDGIECVLDNAWSSNGSILLFKLKLAEAKPLDAFVIKGKLEHSSQPPTPEISSRKSTPNRSPSSVTGIDKSPSSSSPSPSRGRLSCEDRFQKAYFQQANVKTPLKNLLASESRSETKPPGLLAW